MSPVSDRKECGTTVDQWPKTQVSAQRNLKICFDGSVNRTFSVEHLATRTWLVARLGDWSFGSRFPDSSYRVMSKVFAGISACGNKQMAISDLFGYLMSAF
jgi:hypothetical protein